MTLRMCQAIKERAKFIYIYCLFLVVCILLQIGFGWAAGQVASGSKSNPKA